MHVEKCNNQDMLAGKTNIELIHLIVLLLSFRCFCFFFTNNYIYRVLFAGWEVRIMKNGDRGLENAARGRRPRAALPRPGSHFFTIRADPKLANI